MGNLIYQKNSNNASKILIMNVNLDIKEMTMQDIRSTGSIYKYYIGKELLRLGHEVYCTYAGSMNEDWEPFFVNLENFLQKNGPFDAVLNCEQRGFRRRGKFIGKLFFDLVKKYSRKVRS